MSTQHHDIIEALRRGCILTPQGAKLIVGTMKLSTRVGEIERRGMLLPHERIERGWERVPGRKGREHKVRTYRIVYRPPVQQEMVYKELKHEA